MTQAKPLTNFAEIQKVAEQIVEKFRPQRVILFGSYAYGKPKEESDIDLLVVMETGDEDTFQIAGRIADAIDRPVRVWMGQTLHVWLQIHVMAPSEFEASLLRKGVFVTNIANKGIVLYEAPNAAPLSALLAQQRDWKGPGMKPETQEWVEKAERDLSSAHWQMQAPDPNWDVIAFLAQQCAGKYLKAFLEEQNILFQKTHDLIELLDLSGGALTELDPLRPALANLTLFAVLPRYPGMRTLRWVSEKAMRLAQQVRKTVREKLRLPL